MANDFSKEERVAFEDMLEGFNDALVLSKAASVYRTDSVTMERTNDVIWRPMPYIATSIDGAPRTDISALYKDNTQLSVPATIGFNKTVPWTLDANELRDALQEGRLGDAAKQKLASDINVAIMNVAALQGTLVVARSTAATGFDDVAQVEAIMNETGVMMGDRCLALSTRDYNGMANDLSKASRSFGNQKSESAYERAQLGMVASFDTYKLDYAVRIGANAATPTINTTGALVNYAPVGSTQSVAGVLNVDNRFQQVTVTSTAGVTAGDAFTIDGIQAVHLITKQATGQLKTFRVISVDSGTTMTISPPIIGATGTPTDAQAQYQNASVESTSATAAINFLNTTAANINPFWHKDALEILPGRYAIPDNAGASIMRGTTDQGIEMTLTKFFDIDTLITKYRADVKFGVVNKQPEMTGILIFGQV